MLKVYIYRYTHGTKIYKLGAISFWFRLDGLNSKFLPTLRIGMYSFVSSIREFMFVLRSINRLMEMYDTRHT